MSDKAYQDKAVIVTGASAGIGRALVLQLADQGAWIALAARDAQRLDVLAEECRQRGSKAIAVPTDVTDAICLHFAISCSWRHWC